MLKLKFLSTKKKLYQKNQIIGIITKIKLTLTKTKEQTSTIDKSKKNGKRRSKYQ